VLLGIELKGAEGGPIVDVLLRKPDGVDAPGLDETRNR